MNEVIYVPCKYAGNNLTQTFAFEWKLVDSAEVIVSLEEIATGNETVLILGSDYTVSKNEVGGSVTLSVAPSNLYNVIIRRNTSQFQSKGYSTSTGFQGSELEKSFDKVSCNLQEMQHGIEKFEENLVEGFGDVVQDFHALEERTEAIYSYADNTLERAEDAAGRAEQYADSAEFGMKWISFTTSNWVYDSTGNYYELVMNDVPLVNSVYKGSWENKKLIDNIDVTVSSTGSVLKSHEAFNGFVLAATSVIGLYVHEQTLASDEWVIDHNIGYYPTIIVLDSNNIEPVCTRQHLSLNRVKITFETPQSGKAILK